MKQKQLKNKKATAKKTWIFKADNVRDFAWGIITQICMGCHACYMLKAKK